MVYNGWRHFFLAYAGVLITAVFAFGELVRMTGRKLLMRRAICSVLMLCMLSGAAGMYMNHPNESCYYNVLSGKKIMDTDYWNNSCTGALRKLLGSKERNQDLPLEVGCYFFDIQNATFLMTDEERAAIKVTTAKDAPYLYYIEHYVQCWTIPEPEGYHRLFTVDAYGRRIATVYEKDI